MKPDSRFLRQPKNFWAHVRSISETRGYTNRKRATRGKTKVPSPEEMVLALQKRNLSSSRISNIDGSLTFFGDTLFAYFQYRAEILDSFVEPRLMDVEKARVVFETLLEKLRPTWPIPMNKQKGEKKTPAYFTGIINMLIEANIGDFPCDYNPRKLTTITRSGEPLRTLSRWVDGAFPSTVNPLAIWEIKEYYYTKTFGSRVADGVYESLLDGMELQELLEHEGTKVKHYLMVDDHYTWWDCGRSYLCRIMDMLHMEYIDEVLFGYEVVDRLPQLTKEWAQAAEERGDTRQDHLLV